MSTYIKNTWQSGDLISAAKLNNIQNGIESANSKESENSSPVVFFNLEDIINQAKSEDGFRLSVFTDLIQQDKFIVILYNDQNYQGSGPTYGSFFFFFSFLDYSINSSYDNTYIYFKSHGLPEASTSIHTDIELILFFLDSDYLASIDIRRWSYDKNQDASYSETLFSWPEQQLSQ